MGPGAMFPTSEGELCHAYRSLCYVATANKSRSLRNRWQERLEVRRKELVQLEVSRRGSRMFGGYAPEARRWLTMPHRQAGL